MKRYLVELAICGVLLLVGTCSVALGDGLELYQAFWGAEITGSSVDDDVEIEFPDKLTEIRVRAVLGKSLDQSITQKDLDQVTTLTIHDTKENNGVSFVDDLSFLQYFRNLSDLTLRNCGLKELPEVFSELRVTRLDLDSNDLRDISALADNQSIKELNLSGNNFLTDISAVAEMGNLEKLQLPGFSLRDYSPLSNCKCLKELSICCCFTRKNSYSSMYCGPLPDLGFVEKLDSIETVRLNFYPEIPEEQLRIINQYPDVFVLEMKNESELLDLRESVENGLTYMLDGLDPQDVLDFYHNQ